MFSLLRNLIRECLLLEQESQTPVVEVTEQAWLECVPEKTRSSTVWHPREALEEFDETTEFGKIMQGYVDSGIDITPSDVANTIKRDHEAPPDGKIKVRLTMSEDTRRKITEILAREISEHVKEEITKDLRKPKKDQGVIHAVTHPESSKSFTANLAKAVWKNLNDYKFVDPATGGKLDIGFINDIFRKSVSIEDYKYNKQLFEREAANYAQQLKDAKENLRLGVTGAREMLDRLEKVGTPEKRENHRKNLEKQDKRLEKIINVEKRLPTSQDFSVSTRRYYNLQKITDNASEWGSIGISKFLIVDDNIREGITAKQMSQQLIDSKFAEPVFVVGYRIPMKKYSSPKKKSSKKSPEQKALQAYRAVQAATTKERTQAQLNKERWREEVEGRDVSEFVPMIPGDYYPVGTLVVHSKLGRGIVDNIDSTINVLFDDGSIKKFRNPRSKY